MAGRGFTLLELLVALTLSSILLTLAMPAMHAFHRDWQSTAIANRLIGALNHARSLAVHRQQIVTVCPGSRRCLGRDQWQEGLLIFADLDGDAQIGGAETLERVLPPLPPGASMSWRAFRSRSYLQFNSKGYTAWQNGSFLYCPPDRDPRFARMIVLNAQGRARRARDRDGDGIAEDARGRPLSC